MIWFNLFWLEVALNYGLSTFGFLCQSMVNIFPPVQVPLFLGQLSYSVVAQNKFCPLVSKAGLISVRNKVCVHPRPGFYSVWSNHSLWFMNHILKNKCNKSIAPSKSRMCKLSQKLRCRRAEEHLRQVKKCDYFHGSSSS